MVVSTVLRESVTPSEIECPLRNSTSLCRRCHRPNRRLVEPSPFPNDLMCHVNTYERQNLSSFV